MAIEHEFQATTKEGIACHVELDVIEDDEPCVVANVFYLKDKNDEDSYDASYEDELYTITEDDCDIEDLDAVEAFVRKILLTDILSSNKI